MGCLSRWNVWFMNSRLHEFMLIIVFMISFFTDQNSTPEIDIFSKIQPGYHSSFEFACDQLLESLTVFYQMDLHYHQLIRFAFFSFSCTLPIKNPNLHTVFSSIVMRKRLCSEIIRWWSHSYDHLIPVTPFSSIQKNSTRDQFSLLHPA